MKTRYKRMLSVMKVKEELAPAVVDKLWSLYILECSDGSLYTGVTNDLERRVEQHNAGTASKYTRVRRPVVLVYHEVCGTRTAALVRECRVKELPRKEKVKLIGQMPAVKGA